MVDGVYRIGQASKLLGVSSYHLRRLCQAGAIEAELTRGNRWRVKISEVTRLEREGVPPIPQRMPEEDDDAGEEPVFEEETRRPRTAEGLYAAPSEGVIAAAEDVAITENRLRKRRLERELEQEEDFFRERAARDAAEEAAGHERARKDQEQRKRREWENEWITYALDRVPRDAPRERMLEVHSQAAVALSGLQADHPVIAVRRLVEAAVEKALAPWRFESQQRRAMEAALASLPFDLRHRREFDGQKQQAIRLAASAVSQHPPGTAFSVMESAALNAVQPVAKTFEHARACTEVIAWTFLRGASSREQEEARELAAAALATLSTGCSRARIEHARDEALAPMLARIAERERVQAAHAAQERRRKDSEWRVDRQLGHIERYLSEAYPYPGYSGIQKRFEDARRLKEKIHPRLIEECMAATIEDEDLRSRIEELVDELIDELI